MVFSLRTKHVSQFSVSVKIENLFFDYTKTVCYHSYFSATVSFFPEPISHGSNIKNFCISFFTTSKYFLNCAC